MTVPARQTTQPDTLERPSARTDGTNAGQRTASHRSVASSPDDDSGVLPSAGAAPRARPRFRLRRPGRASADAGGRIPSLDGLRGVAAAVVFVYHVFLTQPALAEPYRAPGAGDWWLTYTPLHLIWAGTEAVFVFFVLSGLVLALPVADRGRLNVLSYYPRRMVRLYLPVWAAIGLAVGWAALFPRNWENGDSWWFAEHATDPAASDALGDALLLASPGGANHVLWSLQWEVVYCLALPVVLVLARACRRWWPLTGLAALSVLAALVTGAAINSPPLWYLPMFALGTLMALEHRRLAGVAAYLQRRTHPGRWWAPVVAISVGLLLAYWLLPVADLNRAGLGMVRGLQALGACGIVFVGWCWPPARRALSGRLAQWLGARSFSLYLVHLPVVASVTIVLGGQPDLIAVLLLSSAITFPLTAAFHRFVEQPSHRAARALGRRIAQARGRPPGSSPRESAACGATG